MLMQLVVGVGSGLSSAAEFNHYHWAPALETHLGEFKDYYHFTSPFAGVYYCYSSLEQQWAYYTKYIYSINIIIFFQILGLYLIFVI